MENQEFTMHDNPQMCMLPKLVPIEKLEKIGWMKEEQQEAEIFLGISMEIIHFHILQNIKLR